MPQTIASDLEYSYEGARMIGRYFAPEGASDLPGVLVVHAAHGLGDHVLGCAQRIAELGYAVLALDLWGERRLLTDPTEIGPALGRFSSDHGMWMGRVEAARQALVASGAVDAGRIAVLGYCFGGSTALEFVRSGGDVRAAVSFHGGLDTVGDDWSLAGADGRVLILTGADDPLAPEADVRRIEAAMSEAGIGWETNLYGGARHAFTEPDHPKRPPFAAYHAYADIRSWSAMRDFLSQTLAR